MSRARTRVAHGAIKLNETQENKLYVYINKKTSKPETNREINERPKFISRHVCQPINYLNQTKRGGQRAAVWVVEYFRLQDR